MRRILTTAFLGSLCAGLIACAQPEGGAPADDQSASDKPAHGGSRRGDDWLGNASSFPSQR